MARRKPAATIVGLMLGGVLAWGVAPVSAEPRADRSAGEGGPSGEQGQAHWDMLDEYCVSCHNFMDWAGGIAFDTMDPERVADDAQVWEQVVRKLRGRMMPPPGDPRPTEDAFDGFIGWMEASLDEAAAARPNPGRVALHRLNRKEYANAIQDLLGLQLDPSELLPRDDQSGGFDNVANVLQVSPSFFNEYVTAARQIAVTAVGSAAPGPGSEQYHLPADAEGAQKGHVDGLPLGTRGGMVVEHFFPADGEYVLNIQDMVQDIYFLGLEHENTVLVTLDDRIVYQTTIGGPHDKKWIDLDQSPAADAIQARLQDIRFHAEAGPRRVGVTFLARSFAESEARLTPLSPGGGMDRLMRVLGFEVRGPFNPTGLSSTPSRERIFSCYPESADEERACAEQIVSELARRAYRRPLDSGDRDVLMQFYDLGHGNGGFEEGIRTALTRILASPSFLYRSVVPDPSHRVAESIYRLNDLELASRLSFFLWSRMPDEELLEVAEGGELRDPEVLRAQVMRMLGDPRASTLATNFAYQWLHLSTLNEIDPDPNVFPYAANHRSVVGEDGDLRDELRKETLLFVESIFREDRSVVDLLRADHTYLNERVALHYGINNITGDRFRRVRLDDSVRWGLLGKGAVLMASSYPDRTAPVLRGAWILENITGTPPAPPPPDVEALLDENEPGAREFRTVRERLAAHSEEPSCNACHGVMDPLGFALENFNAVGMWRDIEEFAGRPVDAFGELPDGTELHGPDDLREALLRNPEQFVQTLTEKLMTYALGRTVEYYDMPVIRAIVREAVEDDYRFSSLIMAIVQSGPFQLQRVTEDDYPDALEAAVSH